MNFLDNCDKMLENNHNSFEYLFFVFFFLFWFPISYCGDIYLLFFGSISYAEKLIKSLAKILFLIR